MYWTAHLNDPISLGLHNAILNNVDFQYIYDYFFDPDKVKGQPVQAPPIPVFHRGGRRRQPACEHDATGPQSTRRLLPALMRF